MIGKLLTGSQMTTRSVSEIRSRN